MNSKLHEELKDIRFESKDNVLMQIRTLDCNPSFLSKILNFEIVVPIPIVAVSMLFGLFLLVATLNTDRATFYTNFVIYVIDSGGHYEAY